MRRSTRLQFRNQKTVVRLASVPEHENEDGEVADINNIEEQGSPQPQGPAPDPGQPPPPQLATIHQTGRPTLSDSHLSLQSATLYTFCSNLRAPPLRRWRRQAWISCARTDLPAPPLPPPPALLRGNGTPAYTHGTFSPATLENEEAEGETDEEMDDANGEGSAEQGTPSPEQEEQGDQHMEDAEGIKTRRQLKARHGVGGITAMSGFSQPSMYSFRPMPMSPEIPVAAFRPTPARALPQLHGPYRPPPSYSVAIAQQQQLAAMKGMANGNHSQGTSEITTAAQTEEQQGNDTATQTNAMDTAFASLPSPTLATGQRSCWGEDGQDVNQTSTQMDPSRLNHLKQQVEATCSTLYGRGENPSETSIQEDLTNRHSLLVQILKEQRSGEQQSTAVDDSGAQGEERSAEGLPDIEQVNEQMNND